MDSWRWRGYWQAEEPLDAEAAEDTTFRECSSVRALSLGARQQGDDSRHRHWVLAAKGGVVALLLCVVAGLCLRAGPRRRRTGELGTGDAVDDFILKEWEPAYITWSTHPDKCWDVQKPFGYQNGMKLQIWDCSDKPDKFMVPAGGFGPIKLADAPEFCLDAVGKSSLLQFWRCTEAPRENIMFTVPKGSTGRIQPGNDPSKCVDVPMEHTDNGHRVQQWECGNHDRDMMFVIHWPVTCKWGPWSEWSACTSTCTTSRSRKEFVQEGTAAPGECDGTVSQVNSCQPEDCTQDTITFDSSQRNLTEAQSGKKSGSTKLHPAHSLLLGLLCVGALPSLRDRSLRV